MANTLQPSDLTTPSTPLPQSSDLANEGFQLRFWGVRGNIAAPGADTVRYGGNTACVEVAVAGQRLIFDGGTGLRVLGHHLMAQGRPVSAHLFFTHTHWDRIQGFPFFEPAFVASTHLKIYGSTALNGASIKQRLSDQMLRPNFFIPLQTMAATLDFHSIAAGDRLTLGDVTVEPWTLNRRTSALGFRISWGDRALVYATDTDPSQTIVDPNLLLLASGAQVLIFDGTYVDDSYAAPSASPPVPWAMGVEAAKAAQVEQLVLFHHNPCHSDDQLDELERQVRASFAHSCLAREGMVIDLTQVSPRSAAAELSQQQQTR